MKITKAFFLLVFGVLLTSGFGCAGLPKVSEVMEDAAETREPLQIRSAKGFLSPRQSKVLIERLEHSTDPTNLLERQIAVIESVSESPLIKGNRVTLLIDGPATYAAMFKAVESAKDHINIETFIFEDIIEEGDTGRSFVDLLLKKQSEGVQINLMYDSVGSYGTPASLFKHLRDGGIQVLEFNPVNPLKARGAWRITHRDHRKVLIVDGRFVITGGVNISRVCSSGLSGDESEKEEQMPWRDTDVQIEGPAVAQYQKLFLDSWQRQKGPKLAERNYFPNLTEKGNDLVQVVGSTPGEMNRLTFIMYISAITFAENTIHMTNAYFVPDGQTVDGLTDAAGRGVDVRVILPGKTDSPIAFYAGKYYYSDLLKAGVKLYERREVVLHAKTAVIDGVWSTVGSTNMDFWSFLNNDEVNAVILSHEFAVAMEEMFAADLRDSDEIRWEEWKARPLFPRIREWIAHLFVHWL